MSGVPKWRGALISQEVFNRVLAQIEAETGVTRKEVLSRGKTKRVSRARQYAMWKLRGMTADGHPRYTFPEIGYVFSRDHATVMFAVRKVEARLADGAEVAA